MDWIGCGSEHGHPSWIGLDWISVEFVDWVGLDLTKMDPCPTYVSCYKSIITIVLLIFRLFSMCRNAVKTTHSAAAPHTVISVVIKVCGAAVAELS